MAKRIKVVYTKLLRQKAFGQSHMGLIELDPRLKGIKHLEILLHELCHELFPGATEEEVERAGAVMARTVWHEKYRRIDDHDKDKLQDELWQTGKKK